MQAWIENIFGKHRPFLSLWLAVGSLFALSMLFGAAANRTALDGFAWLGTTLGLPQGYADWIAAVQAWLTDHQIIASNVLGVLIGVSIFAVIIYGASLVKPSGPAGATLFVAWGLAQETGVTGWWWASAVALPVFLLLMWWGNQESEDRDTLKEFGLRILLAAVELLAVLISLPILIYGMFYTLRPKRSS